MLFRKKIEPCCSYCQWSRPGEEGTVICPHRGIMKPWKTTLLTTGILLELVSLAGLIYILSIIPGPELKAMLFLLAPAVGMLYGIFVIRIGARIKV